jgi:hypothetical protein
VTNGGKHLHESGYYVIPCSIKKKTTSKCILINIKARLFCVWQGQIRLRLRTQSPSLSIIRRFIQLVYSKENQPQIVAQRGYQNEKEQKNHTIGTPSLCRTIPPSRYTNFSHLHTLLPQTLLSRHRILPRRITTKPTTTLTRSRRHWVKTKLRPQCHNPRIL